jgi:hypothetical protein
MGRQSNGTYVQPGMADPTVSTDGATKNYVDTTTAAFLSTGDVKLTLKTAAAEHVPQRNGQLVGHDGDHR